MQGLSKLKTPVIIYVNVRDMEHFSVYKGMDSYFVYLADPSFGNIKVSMGKFVEMFYKRKDLSYPGKVLALIPLDNNLAQHSDFMQIPATNELNEEIIKTYSIF